MSINLPTSCIPLAREGWQLKEMQSNVNKTENTRQPTWTPVYAQNRSQALTAVSQELTVSCMQVANGAHLIQDPGVPLIQAFSRGHSFVPFPYSSARLFFFPHRPPRTEAREGRDRVHGRSDRSPVLLIASLAANFKLEQFCSYARGQHNSNDRLQQCTVA